MAVGFAAAALSRRGVSKLEPLVPMDRLPAPTVAVSSGVLRGDLCLADGAAKEVVASALAATLCGGLDIVAALQNARGRDYAGVAALGLEALATPEKLAPALRCGATFASVLKGSHVAQIAVLDGASTRRILALPLSSGLPAVPGLEDATFGQFRGRCSSPACPAASAAGFAEGGVWYGGQGDDVALFANGLRAAPSSASNDPAGMLAQFVAKLDDADAWSLSFHPESVDLAVPCIAAAPPEALDEFAAACLPEGHASDGGSVALDVKVVALLRDEPRAGKRLRFEYVLWARDGEGASSLERKLKEYASAWGFALDKNEAQLMKLMNASRDQAHGAWRAVARTWFGAVRKPTVLRDGDVVRLKVERTLSEDDQASLKAATGKSGDTGAAASIVTTLVEGRPVLPESLAQFVGRDSAAWLLAAPATADDCRKIAGRANDFANDDRFPSEHFLPMSEILDTWGAETSEGADKKMHVERVDERVCRANRLTPSARGCLLGATDIPAMLACAAPVSPEVSDLRGRLQGKWRVADVLADAPLPRGVTRARLVDTTVSVSGSKLEVTGAYDSLAGELALVWLRTASGPRSPAGSKVLKLRVGSRRMQFVVPAGSPETPYLLMNTWDPATGKQKPTLRLVPEGSAAPP